MSQYPDLLEPLLFYILHRANSVIADRQISTTFKAFFIDEAWVFLKNPSNSEIRRGGAEDLEESKCRHDSVHAIARRAAPLGRARRNYRKLSNEALPCQPGHGPGVVTAVNFISTKTKLN